MDKWPVAIAFSVLLLASVSAQNAFGHGVVDQTNTPGAVGFLASIGSAPPIIIQTFTPTVPDIEAIDIFLDGGDSLVRLRIFIIDNAGAKVIEEPNFNPGCPCNPVIPVHVDFTGVQSNPLSVGLTNSIGVQHSPTSSGALTSWGGSVGNAYLPGSAQGPGTSPATDDYFFVTYFLGPPPSPPVVGGELLPIESTSLLLASAQTFSWMIPVILSGIGIGLFVVSRKSE